jgi:hypothetical protein
MSNEDTVSSDDAGKSMDPCMSRTLATKYQLLLGLARYRERFCASPSIRVARDFRRHELTKLNLFGERDFNTALLRHRGAI